MPAAGDYYGADIRAVARLDGATEVNEYGAAVKRHRHRARLRHRHRSLGVVVDRRAAGPGADLKTC